VPEGTADRQILQSSLRDLLLPMPDPALKRRAIIKSPAGTRLGAPLSRIAKLHRLTVALKIQTC